MELKNKIPEYSKRALTLLAAVISVSVIAWMNWQIISGWFGKNGPANLGSIEVSYVSMGKFILDLGFGTWAPFWYFGFPFHVFYTPLLPVLEAFLTKFFGMPLWESYRMLTGAAFILGPVSVFLLGWQLSKRVLGGFISGLLFTVSPTAFYFILKSGEVAADRISVDFWDPRRFTILVRWGEGPHLFSLIFVPLAGVFFARLLEKPKFTNLFFTAIFVGLIALTNAIGLFSGILLLACMSFSKFVINKDVKSFGLMIMTGLVSLGLVSFWYNLTFISTFLREGGSSGNILVSLFPWGWVVGVGLIIFLYYFIRRFLKDFAVSTVFLWFGTLFLVVWVYYTSAPPDEPYRRIELLPQALRYNVEVDLSLSLLLGVVFSRLISFLVGKWGLLKVIPIPVGILFTIVSIGYIQPFIPVAQKSSSEAVDLSKTTENKIATWFAANTDPKKGERVLAPGNYGFYLNWFGYVWQLRGGLFQASTHHWPDHIYYQLVNGKDPEIMKDWLIASNLKYVLITATGSGELYKEIKNLSRFESLKVAYAESGDIIYEVPLKRPSAAKPVSITGMTALTAPVKADNKKNLHAYVGWVESSSQNSADFNVSGFNSYQIRGKIDNGEGIQVSLTADSGWSAKNSSGEGVKLGKDPLGFLMLYPKPGLVNIALEHHTSWQEWLGYLISLLTIGLLIAHRLIGRKKYH